MYKEIFGNRKKSSITKKANIAELVLVSDYSAIKPDIILWEKEILPTVWSPPYTQQLYCWNTWNRKKVSHESCYDNEINEIHEKFLLSFKYLLQ